MKYEVTIKHTRDDGTISIDAVSQDNLIGLIAQLQFVFLRLQEKEWQHFKMEHGIDDDIPF